MKTAKKMGLNILLLMLTFSIFMTLSNSASSQEMSAEPEGNVSQVSSTVYKTELKEGYITLKERDVVEFEWKGMTERIMIREISKDKESVTMTIFIDGAQTPVYTILGFKNHINLDFNIDKNPDLAVGLSDIYQKDVTLFIQPMENQEKNDSGNIIKTGIVQWITILFALVVLGVIAYKLLAKKKSKKNRK